MAKLPLQVGEPAPWFVARTGVRTEFNFDTVAGRYVVLCLFGSAADPAVRQVLDDFRQLADVFDGRNAAFFGVSIDPDDERDGRARDQAPGYQIFWDFDRKVSRLYRAITDEPADNPTAVTYWRHTLVLDERLRVFAVVPFDNQPAEHVARVMKVLAALPPPDARPPVPAPVLVVPRLFEPDLCRMLMKYYDDRGGEDSGFMREVNGKTVGMFDYSHKRRRDQTIEDEGLRKACMVRLYDRLIPEIAKAYQFKATRMERYIVACYEAETQGHFRPHRDDTTKGTAHRRFAVSLNLNTGEFEGGDLRFPEFGRQTYTPPAGGAVVFSCSLLHEATAVTAGKRYAFLPFLYDEAAAQLRQENLKFLDASQAARRADPA